MKATNITNRVPGFGHPGCHLLSIWFIYDYDLFLFLYSDKIIVKKRGISLHFL